MTPADLFRKLSALGLDHEQIAGVLDIMEEEGEERRGKARARVAKWRAKNKPETLRDVTERSVTERDVSSGLTRAEDSSSRVEISGNKEDGARKRATRLEANWIIPDEWLQEAITEGLPRPAALASSERMKNWSLASKDGAKRDWLATWRNWYRRDIEKHRSQAPPKSDRTMDDALQDIINGKFPGEPNPIIETSYSRSDSGGSANLVQLHAVAARRQS